MKAVGVVVEYNPFHNGHYYHIQETKKVTGADVVIAIMSGNFLQRGEPALVSKWTRTKMALAGGADLVIELPYAYATQKAEVFAYGAVSLLNHLLVNRLCFGSEDGKIDTFYQTLHLMKANKQTFDTFIQHALKQGKSYPRAAADAFQKLQLGEGYLDLSQPNNILGYHYLKAIADTNSNMKAYTIKRTKANYHDQDFADATIASATSIRKTLFSNNLANLEAIASVIPKTTYSQLSSHHKQYGIFHDWEIYFSFLKYRLLTMTATELKEIYEMEEGLEHRFLKYIAASETFYQFMHQINTKRYTWTRLQRASVHILTNTTKKEMRSYLHPTYIRLLGASLLGQQYLNQIKKNVGLPLISRLASCSNDQIKLDIKATNVYASALPEPFRSKMIKDEYANPPIRYDQNTGVFLT